MSQSGSNIFVDSSSAVEVARRRPEITPSGSRDTTPYTYGTSTRDYFHQPQNYTPLLSRHYASLQEHAESVMRTASADSDAVRPRDGSRRGSFVWGVQTAYGNEAPHQGRNPVIPQRTDNTTPPTIEELVRSMTGDTSSTGRSSLVQSDAVFSRPSTTRSSVAGTDIDSLARSDTESSISGFARNVARKIPDIRAHRSSAWNSTQTMSAQDAVELEDLPSAQSGKKARKHSIQLPSALNLKNSSAAPHNPPVVEGIPAHGSREKGASPDLPSECSGLAARRQVKMNLTLPVGRPDLSNANEQNDTDPINLSSITLSRPRSPKTPFVREGELHWGRVTKAQPTKTAPIAEEGSPPVSVTDTSTLSQPAIVRGTQPALTPSTLPLPTPAFAHPPSKVRDRYYTSRTPVKGSRNGWLSASESDYGSTPDAPWTPEIKKGMTEQDLHVQTELIQLAKTSRAVRNRRWPWSKSKTSGSEEHAHTQSERNDNRKGNPMGIFRRSNALSDTAEKTKEKASPRSMGIPWRREKTADKPPLPSASLANMLVPPAFVPPGCEKVPTPPMFDSDREVRGKLAGFFFDMNGFPSQKRKSKPSSEGYWDSNAVLMSMDTDLGLTNDKNEEGPEGRPPSTAFHFGPVNDLTGPPISPALSTGANGHPRIKGFPSSSSQASPSTPGMQDSWFRMHYGDYSADDEALTTTALKEADERRKFEWLVPEHLPNSPLCPLHIKYVGPSKGLCYWHGRKSNGWGVEPGRDYITDPMRIGQGNTRGWEVGKAETPKEQKKRDLMSLSDLI